MLKTLWLVYPVTCNKKHSKWYNGPYSIYRFCVFQMLLYQNIYGHCIFKLLHWLTPSLFIINLLLATLHQWSFQYPLLSYIPPPLFCLSYLFCFNFSLLFFKIKKLWWWTWSFPPHCPFYTTLVIQPCKTESTLQLLAQNSLLSALPIFAMWLVQKWENNPDPNQSVHGIFLITVIGYET